MKTMYLNTFFTTLLLVVLGFSLFAQNQSFVLDASIQAQGIEIQDLENPSIHYMHVEYDKAERQVRYHGYIGDEIIYESGTSENLVPLNVFTLALEDHPHKNAISMHVHTAKGYSVTLEVRDYNDGFIGYKLFLDGSKVGEGQARQDQFLDNVKIVTEYADKIDGQDAFNILRFSPIEINAISPFTLFAEQPSWSNGDLELAPPIRSMERKFKIWLGGDRGLRLATDSQSFSSLSGICTVLSEDNLERDCQYEDEEEHDEQNAFLHILLAE